MTKEETSMSTHTPGPWHVSAEQADGTIAISDPLPYVVALTKAGEANARLIASAPSLYSYVATQAAGGDNEAIKLMEVIDGEMRDVQS